MSLLRPTWKLFKVTVNYRHEMMTFTVQRGVLAEDGQKAVRAMMEHLSLYKAVDWKALAEPTWDAKEFDRDALMLRCIGSDLSTQEVIRTRKPR